MEIVSINFLSVYLFIDSSSTVQHSNIITTLWDMKKDLCTFDWPRISSRLKQPKGVPSYFLLIFPLNLVAYCYKAMHLLYLFLNQSIVLNSEERKVDLTAV